MAASHKDLIVWRKTILLITAIYELCRQMPKFEQFGLASQMQRAAVSIAANIAEGNGRSSRKEYARFVEIAKGSCSELETLLMVTGNVHDACRDDALRLQETVDEIARMLHALRHKLIGQTIVGATPHADDPDF